jgi:hypothetical protein
MTKEKNTADTAATMKLDSRRKRHWGLRLCRHTVNTHREAAGAQDVTGIAAWGKRDQRG